MRVNSVPMASSFVTRQSKEFQGPSSYKAGVPVRVIQGYSGLFRVSRRRINRNIHERDASYTHP